MHKLIRLVKRAPGLDPLAFHERWLSEARAAPASPGGALRWRQNHALAGIYGKRDPLFDGFSEEWYASAAERDDACEADPLARLVDPERTVCLPVSVDVILDGPADGAIVSAECIRRRLDLTPAQFDDYWRSHHGPLACALPFERYEQNHLAAGAEKDGPLPYQGVAVVWFGSTDIMRGLPGLPAHDAIRADERNFLAGASPAILARSHVVR